MTYGGWPLYYDVEDTRPGDTAGHDVDEYGAKWYLVAPSGRKQEGPAQALERSARAGASGARDARR